MSSKLYPLYLPQYDRESQVSGQHWSGALVGLLRQCFVYATNSRATNTSCLPFSSTAAANSSILHSLLSILDSWFFILDSSRQQVQWNQVTLAIAISSNWLLGKWIKSQFQNENQPHSWVNGQNSLFFGLQRHLLPHRETKSYLILTISSKLKDTVWLLKFEKPLKYSI